ncbi:isoamylase 1, chloroplastic-like isoform X2 [Salvia splendens]|uniref:isoamylase 1, chloroplastic-like isoform X2 n=1 Tax=Salvia splendens TaxID=180675 RepID=UPI001C2640D5|nr:isoamylase 1, chloroplastic-like isoform X2 [Salvia splendens]
MSANSQSAFAHMELLRSSLIPNYRAPKLTAKRYLHHRENELNFGIPNHSSSKNTGATAKRCAIVNRASERGDADTAVVVEKPPPKPRLFKVFPGRPTPFGATLRDGGVNFAVYSHNAALISLCLIRLRDLLEKRVAEEIALNPLINKTGDVWHVFVKGDFEDMAYGYRVKGSFSPEDGFYFDSSKILVDPYAKAVMSRGEYGALGLDDDCWPQMASPVPSIKDEFDWEGDLPLKHPQKDLIIYEMHVRGFTRHESSDAKFPGTYRGLVEKLEHLKKIGVNCIELMPCHEFNELEYYSYNSVLGDYKMNFWGYSTINYFSPMARYSSAGIGNYGLGAVNEFKYLVREAHKQGIEVIMDVVFNHTAEGNENGLTLSFKGIESSVFYMLAPKGEFYNYSGCGNTFNCNHPVVRQFILDSLRYWVTEMHVDGFRFDLASILTRSSCLWDAVNVYGSAVEAYSRSMGLWRPLSSRKLSPLGYLVRMEWQDGFSGALAEGLCGSPNLYQKGGRKPWSSINFVCAHDGFTLADLVTYNDKHNSSNGEDNKDGENHNNSWNCGQEGEFVRISVKKLRSRQMRNFFLCLMVSQGVPMIYMGDEYGHTKGGNNNTYCHDNFINYFRWDKMEEASSDFFRFCSLAVNFRRECESLGLDEFPTAKRLQWHGHAPGVPDWSDTSRFVAFTLIDTVKRELYIAFNASHVAVVVALPERPGYKWEPLVDTGKPAPYDFLANDIPNREAVIQQYAHFLDNNLYPMISYSSIVLTLSLDLTS